MIPGYPPNTSLATVAMNSWGIHTCGSHIGCKKGLGPGTHSRGRVDYAGTIHWTQVEKRATRRGVRNLAKLIALAYNSHWRKEPVWMRLYLTNVWATEQIKAKLHYRVRASWSYSDRVEARQLASRRRRLRTTHRMFYMWLYRAGLTPQKGRDNVRVSQP